MRHAFVREREREGGERERERDGKNQSKPVVVCGEENK
jgi:hypothetical protein